MLIVLTLQVFMCNDTDSGDIYAQRYMEREGQKEKGVKVCNAVTTKKYPWFLRIFHDQKSLH